MRLEEFVRLNPKQVRGDKELMQLFVNFYEAAFSIIPKCVGCSFKSGFKKLKKYSIKNKDIVFNKTENMKTFQLKKQFRLKILTYKKDGKTYRCYGYNLTEDFAIELVKAGKSDLFVVSPTEKVKDIIVNEPSEVDSDIVSEVVSKVSYKDMDYRTELIPLYNDIKEKTGRKAKSFKKEDVIEFLKNES